MTTSDSSLESAINDLVDKLEQDKETENIKLMNDSLFAVDMDVEIEDNFNIGEPKKKEEDKIIYI